ncbi:hypothetical protein TNCT_249081 [Trichonephila clavata]|uniref:Uncharacterized protein n=1 Tax=Trichonephila clavata TaxID=2740835 RepID=A0A8X6FNX7_TRICU|nr:hypothetical protein TNCT_249081 [Trichonephila clavata]
MENKTVPEEASPSNDKAQNGKSPPAPPNERQTEEFIADNAAAISESLKLRAVYAAARSPSYHPPETSTAILRRTRNHLKQTYRR